MSSESKAFREWWDGKYYFPEGSNEQQIAKQAWDAATVLAINKCLQIGYGSAEDALDEIAEGLNEQ